MLNVSPNLIPYAATYARVQLGLVWSARAADLKQSDAVIELTMGHRPLTRFNNLLQQACCSTQTP